MSRYFSFLALIALFVQIFASCGKDVDVSVQLLETISYNGKLRQKFEYDKQCRISKIIHYSYYTEDDQIACTQTFDYDHDGDLISLYFDMTENPHNNRLISITKPVENIITLQNEISIVLDNRDLPIKYEGGYYQYFDGNVRRSSPVTIVYNIGSIEITTIVSIGVGYDPLVITHTFDDDERKSPFYYCKTQKWALFPDYADVQYNILASTWKGGSSDIEATTTFVYTYTYDNAGFPVTKKILLNNDYVGTESYAYQSKKI